MFEKKCGCFIPAIVSIILAIIVGIISFSEIIPELFLVILVALGIGIGSVFVVLYVVTQTQGREERCICKYGDCVSIGAIGTIITAIIGLTVTIVTGSIAISVLIGLGTLFLSFTIFSVLELLLCLTKTSCKCRD